jgi:hypothetical protein
LTGGGEPFHGRRMSDFEAVIDVLGVQAGACAAMGAPFTGGLLERAAEAVLADEAFASAFRPWAGGSRKEIWEQAVALRWLGAIHDGALAEPDSPLARAYPAANRAGDLAAAWPLTMHHMQTNPDSVADFMRREPQTNEVRRSAVLLPGFLAVAEATSFPMRILELGASAGLNQLWDRRRYQLAPGMTWGPETASVLMDTEWRGAPPPLDATIEVVARAACDRSPIDLADPAQRRRLRAYIWADQPDRLARFDSAVAEALAQHIVVERSDAVDWTRANAAPKEGVVTVAFHSVFFQYMPRESQTALVETLNAFGEEATTSGPLAWLRMEPSPSNPAVMELRLTQWPVGDERLLAHAHPHGAWIEWRG